jgi:hypothetical protein
VLSFGHEKWSVFVGSSILIENFEDRGDITGININDVRQGWRTFSSFSSKFSCLIGWWVKRICFDDFHPVVPLLSYNWIQGLSKLNLFFISCGKFHECEFCHICMYSFCLLFRLSVFLYVCPSVCLCAWNNSIHAGRIFTKFYIPGFRIYVYFDKIQHRLKYDKKNGFYYVKTYVHL